MTFLCIPRKPALYAKSTVSLVQIFQPVLTTVHTAENFLSGATVRFGLCRTTHLHWLALVRLPSRIGVRAKLLSIRMMGGTVWVAKGEISSAMVAVAIEKRKVGVCVKVAVGVFVLVGVRLGTAVGGMALTVCVCAT